MIAIEDVLGQPAARAIGWTLLHFLWQGALVGTVTAFVLTVLRRSAADVRYVVATIGLSLMLTLPVVTMMQVWGAGADTGQVRLKPDVADGVSGVSRPSGTDASVASGVGAVDAAVDGPGRLSVRPRFASLMTALDAVRVEPWLPLLVLVWFSGVAVLTLRLLNGWLWVRRMKGRGTSLAGEALQRAAERLARRLHIHRRVRLLRSTLVEVPTVIGWLKPVVLLPVGALAGLTPEQLEAVLAHELAHIRRHDYAVNLLQTLVETLLFYHPAVWWLSRQIRIERENCCDDLAVSLCGDPYTYARALADLEQLRGRSGQLALAATGGSLLQRVRRLLGAPTHAGRAPGWLAGLAAIVLTAAIAVGAAGTDPFQTGEAATVDQRSSPPAAAAVSAARSRPSSGQEPAERARALAAAADNLQRTANTYQLAAEAAAWLQRATGQATTPLLAGPPLQAKAAALEGAAQNLSAQASASTATPAQEVSAETAMARAAEAMRRTDPMSADALAALAPSAGLPIGGGQGRSHGSMSWSNNGEKLEVKYDGDVEFTDDDMDVKRLSPNGYLRIRDGGWLGGRTVEFRADSSGNITRRFFVGLTDRPFEPEGREWLRQAMPRFIRHSGIGASSRVARFLKAGGTAAVLAEIARIEGSWAKRVYFRELLAQATLDAPALRQVLAQAGREIDSDFELASLLISHADKLLTSDETVRQAYFDAARSINSDFEMRRVYSEALKRTPVSSGVLASILDASRNVDSDFEQASLLIQIAKLQALDRTTRGPFFAALATVGSDFEHRRVLSVLVERTDQTPEVLASILESIATAIDSDFEAASILLQLTRQYSIEGAVRAPFFRAVDSISSAFERGRVLKAVVSRSDVSNDTVLSVLRAARTMTSGHETSQVLLSIAASHSLSGESRDAYIDAAEKLGDYEQGRVLAALVRGERRVR